MSVSVTFHGACGIVTGSCFEVRGAAGAVLIDCGMFQGTKTVKALNYDPLPFLPASIDTLLLTHAHIDHCGLVPKLTNAGFKGQIIATRATADLLSCVLPDSGYVQEMEVMRLNRRNHQRGRPPVEPIYTRQDGEACAKRIKARRMDTWFDAAPGIRARFWDAGHILGSASIELAVASGKSEISLLFSGDIGTGNNALQGPPQAPAGIDYLFMESTYGDRIRPQSSAEARRAALCREVHAGLSAGGVVLIPAFAVERTQQLLFDLDHLFDIGALPEVPVFVDSPLASKTTQVFRKYVAKGDDSETPFTRSNLRFIESAENSRKLERFRSGAVIIAGSGMCDAGRIRYHLKNYLSESATTVLLVGYQAPGSLGRLLSQHVPMVRIQGDEVAVNARIRTLDEYSGHADQKGLLRWFSARAPVRNNIFLIHGEETARLALTAALQATGVDPDTIRLPHMGETVVLTSKQARTDHMTPRIEDPSAFTADWHNRYAEAVLALRQKLEAAPDDRSREQTLRKVNRALRQSP